VATELDHYVRLLELMDSVRGVPLIFHTATLQPAAGGLEATGEHPWAWRYPLRAEPRDRHRLTLRPINPEAHVVFNSAFPRTANDGPLWAGRGISGLASAGFTLAFGPVTGRLEPAVHFAQNRDFTLAPVQGPPRSPFDYPWSNDIDYPQRFGTSALTSADWGQSGIRLDLGHFTAGVSNEDLWWGPGIRNAIVMSNTAPGIPHADLGTGSPIPTRIGAFEIRGVWGAMHRSDYADQTVRDGTRFLSGLTLGYQPKFLPGLTIGLTRLLYKEWPVGGVGFSDIADVLGRFFNPGKTQPDSSFGNDDADQMTSLVGRWVAPHDGLELYFEWARNDFAGNLRDLLVQPDHSRSYTLGFQKRLDSRGGPWRLTLELTMLGSSAVSLLRGLAPTYYAHPRVLEGYTNRGQLMGAAIGPGSSSQYLGVDRYFRQGRWGIFLERARTDDDYALFGDAGKSPFQGTSFPYDHQQVDLTLGISVFRFVGRLDVGGTLELTRELNRYFVRNADVSNVKFAWSIRPVL
jgi:hypothetical protein